MKRKWVIDVVSRINIFRQGRFSDEIWLNTMTRNET
jgi:hypothetical protein